MSKKKFKVGLESLFGVTTEEAFQEESPLLDKKKKEEKGKKKKEKEEKTIKNKKKRSSKNFTSDLDTLFQEALTDTINDSEVQTKSKTTKQPQALPPSRQRRLRRLSGLDALIRHTGDMETVEVNVPTKKRVTFVFEKDKLAKLKEIAKGEKAYLKDIIGRVVSNFIEKYEKQQN